MLIAAAAFGIAGTSVTADTGGLTVSGVQLSIDTELYASETAFTAGIEKRIRQIVRRYSPDLIVFPEYTSVFLAAIPHADRISGAVTVTDALTRIATGGLGCPSLEQEISGNLPLVLKEFFISESGGIELMMDRIWGGLAAKYGVYIVAGTYFAVFEDSAGRELRNRLVVYGPGGRVVYTQDKALLSSFEEEMLMLSTGSIHDADGIFIGDAEVVFTICRSTFLEQWEDIHAGADIWIDIKAEGVPFDEEVRRRFVKALPSRIAGSDVPYGLTVCLTGRFLDLSWEGKSSAVTGGGGEFEYAVKAAKHDSEEVVIFSLR